MTLDELVSEEKKLKSQKTITAVIIGFLVGVAVYAATRHKLFLTGGLLLAAYWVGNSHSKSLKSVQAEISRRGPAR